MLLGRTRVELGTSSLPFRSNTLNQERTMRFASMRILLPCVGLALLISAGVSHASTIFLASGSMSDGASISGTLTIDTTIGTVTAGDLFIGAPDNLALVN